MKIIWTDEDNERCEREGWAVFSSNFGAMRDAKEWVEEAAREVVAAMEEP